MVQPRTIRKKSGSRSQTEIKKAIAEIHRLSEMMENGRLEERGQVETFSGPSAELIQAINQMLDAAMDPVGEVRRVLRRLANLDLGARMKGKYKGGYDKIQKDLNLALRALNDTFQQATETADRFSFAAEEMKAIHSEVSRETLDQSCSLQETSRGLEGSASQAKETANRAEQTAQVAQETQTFIKTGKEVMLQGMAAMKDIHSSAEETLSMIQEINNIAAKTEELATNTAAEARKVGAAARGFSVVAEEMRKSSMLSHEVAQRLAALKKQAAEGSQNPGMGEKFPRLEDLAAIIKEVDQIALKTNYLALNAAVEAAHVGEAGRGFELVTEEVRSLANRSKESALKTEALLQRSLELAKKGGEVSQEANQILMKADESINSLANHVRELATASMKRSQQLEVVYEKVANMRRLSQENAGNAGKSSKATEELAKQAEQLKVSLKRFQLDSNRGVPSE